MKAVPERPVSAFPFRAKHFGLEIGVEPYIEPSQVKRHFGANLLKHDILPIHIAFRNESAQSGFLLQPEYVVLIGNMYEQESADYPIADIASNSAQTAHTIERAAPVALLVTPIILIPGFLAIGVGLGNSAQDWADIAGHMERVRFNDRPLYQSDSNSGFLYFKLPESSSLAKVEALKFRVKNMLSREEKSVTVRLKKL
jgi:hypothetical protein